MKDFDFSIVSPIWSTIKSVAYKIFILPYKWWLKVPTPIKISLFIIIGIIAAIILYKAIKKRHEWKHRRY